MAAGSEQNPRDAEQRAAQQEPEQPAVPRRELRDPKALRALSHPVRLKLLDELVAAGSATATELAERIGESPANCSWHLRQLAQHGFVEEAGGGTGRQRPWRIVLQSTSVPSPGQEDEPEFATARETLIEIMVGREVEAWRAWHARQHQEPVEWREASVGSNTNGIWLTVAELAAFKADLRELVHRHLLRHLDRIMPEHRPPGSRPLRFLAWAIPVGPPHAASGDAGEGTAEGAPPAPGESTVESLVDSLAEPLVESSAKFLLESLADTRAEAPAGRPPDRPAHQPARQPAAAPDEEQR